MAATPTTKWVVCMEAMRAQANMCCGGLAQLKASLSCPSQAR
jgi:hypothetical protein